MHASFWPVILSCCNSKPRKASTDSRRTTSRKPLESQEAKQLRIADSRTRKTRAISGWNVFQRTELEGKACSTTEYKAAVKEISAKWKSMTDAEGSPFVLRAQQEQLDREDVSQTPLPLKGEGLSELELKVGRKGLKKCSSKRLAVNEMQFQDHQIWNAPTQLGDGLSVSNR